MNNIYTFINAFLLCMIVSVAHANSLVITNAPGAPVDVEITYTVKGFCRTDTHHLEPQQTISLDTGACFVEQVRASSFYSRMQQALFRPVNGAKVNITIFQAGPNQFGIQENR